MKRICRICCVVMTLVTLALTVSPAMAQEKTMSGLYGEDMIWLFTPGNSTLTVRSKDEKTAHKSNAGDAYNMEAFWEAQGIQNKIRKVVVEEGVTQIGSAMFRNCSELEEVELPQSLTHIQPAAFANTAVSEIVIPENVIFIGDGAFAHCRNLYTVKCEAQHQMDLGTNLYFDTPYDSGVR